MPLYFGAHIYMDFTSYESMIKSANLIKSAGGNLLQIMLHEPINSNKLDINKLTKFKNYLRDNNMKIVLHSSYTHNIARNWDQHSWWLHNFMSEIQFAHYIGAIGIVLHFGKKLDLTIQEAYNNMYTFLVYVNNKTQQYKDVPILLETSTGQGTETCYKLEDLAHFYKKFSKSENKQLKDRIKLCIDTCHIFAAGYDIRSKTKIKLYLETFEELVGLRYVSLIHLNDCKVDIGEQRDRHQSIGDGYIGFKGLKIFFDYFKKLNIPIVLETPGEGFKKEIKLLK